MITVIKNGKAKRVCCPYCESLLEYEVNDLMMGGVVGKFYYYLPCPVCGEEIVGDYFKALVECSRERKSAFAKLGKYEELNK
jgi:hypothetical protein